MSMLTFDQARKIAERKIAPRWDPQHGTMFANTTGYEDADGYAVTVGAEEWLVDQDPNYIMADGILVLVERDTGRAVVTTHHLEFARLDRMRQITSE